jgi:xanthine/uracil permease
MRPRQFVPPAFVGTMAILGIGSLVSRRSRRALMGVTWIYTLSNLVSTTLLLRRAKFQVVRKVPLVYALMHVGYGLGFLMGLWEFRSQWEDSWRRVKTVQPRD